MTGPAVYDKAIEKLRKEADGWEALTRDATAVSLDTGIYDSQYTEEVCDAVTKISAARKLKQRLLNKKKSLNREISLSVQLPRFKAPHRAVLNKGRFIKIYKDAKCVAEGEIPVSRLHLLFEFPEYAIQQQVWAHTRVGKHSITMCLTSNLEADEIDVRAASLNGSRLGTCYSEREFWKKAVAPDPAT